MTDSLFNKKGLRLKVVGRNLDDLIPMLQLFPVELVDENPELVISYGGDGSLLGAERDFPGVPKCPLRDFRQNPKCPLHSEMATLKQLFAGELRKDMLMKLEAVTDDGRKLYGINDIVLSLKLVSSAIRYRLWVNDELFRGQVVADSLLVATPFGSTGYYQSVTHGNFQVGLGLAFNNSMDLFGHTVVAETAKVSVALLRGPAVMVADNDPNILELDTGAQITIQACRERTPVYGLDVFRCQDCYALRKNGVN